MHILIALIFAFVRTNDQLEVMLEQEVTCDVRSEVCTTSAKGVREAAVLLLRIGPELYDERKTLRIYFIVPTTSRICFHSSTLIDLRPVRGFSFTGGRSTERY